MQRNILITGASSGIGRATATELAKAGFTVILTARREDKLATIAKEITDAGGTAFYQTSDVSDYGSLEAIGTRFRREVGTLHGLVNCAGIMPIKKLEEAPIEEWLRIIDVNLNGTLRATKAILPHLLEHTEGHVVNVGSTASLKVVAPGTIYAVTKHAVRAFSEGLRQEMLGRIKVTQLNPGATESELFTASNSDEEASQNLEENFSSYSDPVTVARAVRYALQQPPETDISEITLRPVDQAM